MTKPFCFDKQSLSNNYFTYFVSDEKHVKIGRSITSWSRLNDLQRASGPPLTLLCLLEGDREMEHHRMFHELRYHDEWFFLNDDIEQYAKDNSICNSVKLLEVFGNGRWTSTGVKGAEPKQSNPKSYVFSHQNSDSIESIGFTKVLVSALKRHGITSVEQLHQCNPHDLWRMRGIGSRMVDELLAYKSSATK